MNTAANIINIAQESFVLGALTLSVLVLLGIIGLWPVLVFFPRDEALRWPLFAPVTGMALLTVLGLPLSLMGLPVNRWALVIAVVSGLVGTAVVLHLIRSSHGRRLLFSYFRIRCLVVAVVFLVPVLISTSLIIGSHGGHVRDVWGSGDFGAYWIVADFMRDFGATIQSYTNQNLYYASDIQDHLSKHARLGCMVTLSFLGTIISPVHINNIIIPFVVASIILTLGLAQRWLELERLGNRWFLLPLLSYPLLYFLLYFTYVSQATGVLLFVAGLLLVGGAQVKLSGRKKTSRIFWSAILVGASLLHYPSIILAGVMCLMLLIVKEIRTGTLRNSSLWLATVLLVSSHYLPQIIHELSLVNSGLKLPGWDWKSMPGALEFIGFRSVLGYDLPLPRSTGIKLLDYVAGCGLCGSLLYGVWFSRLRVASLTVVTTTALLATVAYVKYLQQIPHASHAFVKSISTFALFLLMIMVLPLGRLATQKRTLQQIVIVSLAGILIVGQLLSVNYGSRQRTWYTDDLVSLSRRQLERGYFLRYDPDIHWEMRAPIVRDARRIIQDDSVGNKPLLVLISSDRLPYYDRSRIIDREGDYYAVRSATD